MHNLLMFFTTFIIQFIIAVEMNLISPLAPYLSNYFGIKDSSVILFNLGYSAVGFLVPYLGVLADRYGKKRILSFSVVLFVFGTIIASFSNTPLLFGFGRIFIGIGYFSLSGTNLSYVSEFIDYDNRGKASGILRAAFGLAILISPIYSTSMISRFDNLSSVYLPLTVLGILAFLLLLKLPETSKSLNVKVNISEIVELIKEPQCAKVFLSLFLILTAPAMLLSFFGIYASNTFNLSQFHIGIAYSILAIGTVLGIIFSTLFSDKFGKLKISKIFFIIMVLAQIPIPYINNLYLVIGLSTLFAFGLDGGWTSYQTYGSEVQTEKRATFMSLFYTVNALAVTIYSLLGPLIYNLGGYKFAVGLGTISSALAILVLFKLEKD